MRNVTIIGGGVVGITTALHLQRMGHHTTVVTHLNPLDHIAEPTIPQFASLYPAALVVPHSVEMKNLHAVFEMSQKIFAQLSSDGRTGVRWQRHYEITATPNGALPDYSDLLRDYRPYDGSLDEIGFEEAIGRKLHGWSALCLFVETPRYLRHLYREYAEVGGNVVIRRLGSNDVPSLDADVIVNCTGLWARELCNDPHVHAIRGYLVRVLDAPFPVLPHGENFSYNYKPPDSEYLYDVYFFPRSDGWLLGGSRENSDTDGAEPWTFPDHHQKMVDGVPEPVLTINRTILKHATRTTDIADLQRRSFYGYRPGRRGGVRLELAEEFGRPVIHNYGHGGGGVCLSWGCADIVGRLVEEL